MGMLAAYFDESSDGLQKNMFLAGGCVGSLDKWLDLETKWLSQLKDSGIDEFHGHDMTSKDRQPFYELIAKSKLAVIVVGVDLRAFNKLATEPANRDAFGGTPYYLAYHLAMLRTTHAVRQLSPQDQSTVSFFCDTHKEFSPYLSEVHRDLQKLDGLVGGLWNDSPQNLAALQVADAVVGEMRRQIAVGEARVLPGYSAMDKAKVLLSVDMCSDAGLAEFLQNSRDRPENGQTRISP